MMLRDMARAGRWELEDVDENSFVGITGIVSQHSVVDELLSTFALVARSKKTAS